MSATSCLKQFGHHSQFKDRRSQISYTDKHTAHVGVLIDKKVQEVYRVQLSTNDRVVVCDMLDELHWFAPSVEGKHTKRYWITIEALARKYERLARKQLLS